MKPVLLLFAASLCMAQTREFASGDHSATASVHASTVVELGNGDVMAAWFGGSREAAPDVAIYAARRTAEGWQPASEAAREPGIASFNPVLFYSGDGLLWLYYKFGPSPGFWSPARIKSSDAGLTWSAPEHLPAGLYGPIRTKPLVLGHGIILSGSSVESYGSWACWIERSSEYGKTWKRIGPIAASHALAAKPTANGEAFGIIQPSLLDLGGSHIRLYARSSKAIGRICVADSFDGGFSWSPVATTTLPNPNSGIDAVRLGDGRIVMIYNRSESQRTPLYLAVSAGGTEWKDFLTIESGPGEYSYPAMVVARNGDLLITYTWKREKIAYVRVAASSIR